MALTFPLEPKAGQRSLHGAKGGLLALVSIALHGVLLGVPLPEVAPTPPPVAELIDPATVVAMVRLPPAPQPVAESVPPASPTPPSAPAPPPRATPPSPETSALPVPPVPEARPDLVPTPPQTLDERLLDPAAYEFNRQAKGLIANEVTLITTVISAWLEAAAQGVSDSDIPVMGTKLAPLQVTYPIATCLTPPPAAGLVGVIVSPAGKLISAVLLDSTGYTVLDDKALAMARQQTFALVTGDQPNPSAHWLPVEVLYDSHRCTP